MSKADERTDITVAEYVAGLTDETLREDTQVLMAMMSSITAEEPILYGFGTIGYGVYHYEYTSGRKGDVHTLAFYPRTGKITVYLMDGTARYNILLKKLGKHSTTGYCIYIKRLSDVDLAVLREILEGSYRTITTLSQQGPIDHIMWREGVE